MSRTVANLLYSVLQASTLPLSSRQKAKTLSRVAEKLMNDADTAITTSHGELCFFAGRGPSIASSVARFYEDEPETLWYIDNVIQEGQTFFDIGANAGLYSLYAAKRGAEVYAFEPSAFNFSLLVDHIRTNQLSESIKPLCIAFSDKDELADLFMAELCPGHSSNAVGEARNQFGGFTPAFKQAAITFRVDTFTAMFGVVPTHIKLDVDGLEPFILAGAPQTLSNVKSLLVEIEGGNTDENAQIFSLIDQAGLKEDIEFRSRSAHGRNRLFLKSKK